VRALVDAGLLTIDHQADVTVTNTDGTLGMSLAELSYFGVDHVTTSNAGNTLDLNAGIADPANLSELQTALNQLLAGFENGHGGYKPVFTAGDTVDLTVAGASGITLDGVTSAKLALLGIDDVKDEFGNSIKS
jgi:hypothetical protein